MCKSIRYALGAERPPAKNFAKTSIGRRSSCHEPCLNGRGRVLCKESVSCAFFVITSFFFMKRRCDDDLDDVAKPHQRRRQRDVAEFCDTCSML